MNMIDSCLNNQKLDLMVGNGFLHFIWSATDLLLLFVICLLVFYRVYASFASPKQKKKGIVTL